MLPSSASRCAFIQCPQERLCLGVQCSGTLRGCGCWLPWFVLHHQQPPPASPPTTIALWLFCAFVFSASWRETRSCRTRLHSPSFLKARVQVRPMCRPSHRHTRTRTHRHSQTHTDTHRHSLTYSLTHLLAHSLTRSLAPCGLCSDGPSPGLLLCRGLVAPGLTWAAAGAFAHVLVGNGDVKVGWSVQWCSGWCSGKDCDMLRDCGFNL